MLNVLDLDECQDPSYSCEINSHCVNDVGTYVCQCDIGYKDMDGSGICTGEILIYKNISEH